MVYIQLSKGVRKDTPLNNYKSSNTTKMNIGVYSFNT